MNVPTGYRKSLVYQVLPFCASFILERLGKAGKTPAAVLVVSPSLTLMVPGAKTLLLSEELTPEESSLVDGKT